MHLPPDTDPIGVQRSRPTVVERSIRNLDALQGISLRRRRCQVATRHVATSERQVIRIRTGGRLAGIRGGNLVGSDPHPDPLAGGWCDDDRKFPGGASEYVHVEAIGTDDGGDAACQYRRGADAQGHRPGRRLLASADHVQDDETASRSTWDISKIRRPPSRYGKRVPSRTETIRSRIGDYGRQIEGPERFAHLHRRGLRSATEGIGRRWYYVLRE